MTPKTRTSTALALVYGLAACSGGHDTTAPTTGSLDVTVTNPSGGQPNITITGPSATYHVASSQTLSNLAPGAYVVVPDTITTAAGLFGATPARDTVNIQISRTAAQVNITYAKISLDIHVVVTGLPAGLKPGIYFVRGNNLDSVRVDTTGVYPFLAGHYYARPFFVQSADSSYGWDTGANGWNITNLSSGDTILAPYSAWFDTLAITASGLPGGVHGNVQITGPFSYSKTVAVNGKTVVGRVPAGNYFFAAQPLVSGGQNYTISPDTQSFFLYHNNVEGPTFAYAIFDLSIDHMYVTQEVQKVDGSVPLIAGKDAYIRVFGKATLPNSTAPKVRVRWYLSGSLIRTDTIADPGGSTPVNIDDAASGFSWDERISGSFIQPGLAALVDINFDHAFTEATDTNNVYPVNGTPLAFDVRTADSADIKIVPIDVLGREPSTPAGGWSAFVGFLQTVHPIPGVKLSVHAMYFSSASQALQSGDGNGGWESVLTEIAALEVAESAPVTQHYYGVVNTNYPGGVAGLGYVGAPGAMGWDKSIADQIMAHEIGHNWNRLHSPCGGPAGVDPNYPYTGAQIGQPGFDIRSATPYPATTTYDIMGYCQPYWISDYTFKGVLDWRSANEDRVRGGSNPNFDVQPVTIVWGHMRGNQVVLEPAFETTSRVKRPEGFGSYTLEGLDENGGRVFATAFQGVEIADGRRGDRSFAFAIPTAELDRGRLSTLRVSGAGVAMERVGGTIAAAERAGTARAPSKLAARRLGGQTMNVTWDAASYPLAVVKDARTGEILSLARGGAVRVQARGDAIEVVLSDGVRSAKEIAIAQ